MPRLTLDQILSQLHDKSLTPQQAKQAIMALRAEPLGFATVDHDRRRRCGFAEVIYAAGKTPEHIIRISQSILEHEPCVLATRTGPEHVEAICGTLTEFPIEVGSRGGTVIIGNPPDPEPDRPVIPVITAGTSDLPVAEEALLTCKALGQPAVGVHDVGVAGLHRIEPHLDMFRQAAVLICIAGMEGALPSVIGGLVEAPVIAVPTSVGYGASFGGITALLSMLTSCASGVSVVNIDNGFGAAYNACLINRQSSPRKQQNADSG
ncbi:MAG: nickel pincer cofactor biosynthesis protein LarB [Phycisphaeraceae bacterium]